jgi:hypothetical protein
MCVCGPLVGYIGRCNTTPRGLVGVVMRGVFPIMKYYADKTLCISMRMWNAGG